MLTPELGEVKGEVKNDSYRYVGQVGIGEEKMDRVPHTAPKEMIVR
jgi:hypothetical protein